MDALKKLKKIWKNLKHYDHYDHIQMNLSYKLVKKFDIENRNARSIITQDLETKRVGIRYSSVITYYNVDMGKQSICNHSHCVLMRPCLWLEYCQEISYPVFNDDMVYKQEINNFENKNSQMLSTSTLWHRDRQEDNRP